ncbi:protein EARLY FLOWERING 3-like [Solanum lycopersicum]|uniref:protein EARLY FLOWERING 3-like n=1 Tax=Solanum lycopersicum TaxID=4081 RepID=UPI003749D68B
MKRGTGEEKVMGPMFPRLNVNDTEKGGPRAPPRNKMALYEQLSIPSQRYNPGDLPHNSSNSANLVLPHPSQENEHERGVLFSRQLPALRHPVEKPYGRSSGSNTPLREVKSKRQTEKEDFRVPTFGNSKERAVNTEDYSKGTSDIDKRDSTLKRTDQLSHVTPRENLVNTFGESHKTNIVQLEFRSDCQVDCTVFSGSVIDVDNDSQEDKTCKSSQTGEMAHSDELSETSMVEYVSEMDISPDNVVRMIGQKHFWKARRAIANQQRTLALQVFELHRLLKVQKLIAGSPNLNLEDNAYLGKPLKRLSAKRVCLEHSVKAPEIVSRPKNDSEKPKGRMECNAENDVGKTSLSSVRQPSSCNPLSEKQLPTPVKHDSLMSPWYFNQPPGHQWLIPMMSPSEGLVYKPHSGPAVMSPVYGGCGPPGSTPMTGNFLASAYGLPFAPPTGHGYFRPFGMPVTNPAIPSPTQNQSNQVVASHSKGQLSGGRASFNIQHPNSSNVGSESDGTLPEVVRLYPSRDSELHASTAGSPSEITRAVDMGNSTRGRSAFHHFPTSPAVDNPILRPQPHFPERPARAIKAIPHNARSATESVARIFQSIQEERKQY